MSKGQNKAAIAGGPVSTTPNNIWLFLPTTLYIAALLFCIVSAERYDAQARQQQAYRQGDQVQVAEPRLWQHCRHRACSRRHLF